MADSKTGAPPPRRFAAGEQETLAETLGGVLVGLLTRKFRVPLEDAQLLVRETFLAYSGLDAAPPDARAWLIAGACRNAMTYLERRGLTAGGDAPEETRAVEQLLRRDEALALLPERAREVLRLRFEEGKTYPEIAAKLGVTIRSAQRIVSSAAAQLRRLNR